jgi:pre-60S factor REI1
MVELPALSAEQFEAAAKANDPLLVSSDKAEFDDEDEVEAEAENEDEGEDKNEDEDDLIQDTIDRSSNCLFCSLRSPNMEANILHMHTIHGLFIPSPDQLLDMKTFLGYLASVVFTYNTCLYCNTERRSVEGIQTHMRDKGHCMINLDAESELLEFWDLEEIDEESDDIAGKMAAVKLSDSEMRLPSGAIINSRSDSTQLRAKPALTHARLKSSQFRVKKNDLKAIADADADPEPNRLRARNDRQLAIRGEMGLLGLSDMQKRALQVTEKKLKKREMVARAAQRWATEKVANKQKYFKV